MSKYKRLTNNNLEEYDPEYDFCIDCKYFGEPNGCNRPNGTCGNYERFIETYNRLAGLEDDLESGKLVRLPCRVGDKIYTCYAVSVDEWEVESIQIFDFDVLFRLGHKGTNDYNSHYLSDFGKTIFFTKAEAEKKLEELSKNP